MNHEQLVNVLTASAYTCVQCDQWATFLFQSVCLPAQHSSDTSKYGNTDNVQCSERVHHTIPVKTPVRLTEGTGDRDIDSYNMPIVDVHTCTHIGCGIIVWPPS